MRCVRLALVFAATLFAVAVTEAQPQPRPRPADTATPLAVVVLAGIDDPVVVDELKLKDEQVNALVARRKEVWDAAYTTAPNQFAKEAGVRATATDALLKKTLTADQYKRAVQLGAQAVLGSRGFRDDPDAPPAFRLTTLTSINFRQYPELATAFKLTEEQQKQLTAPIAKEGFGKDGFGGGTLRAVALSKEQSAAAKEFLGPVAKAWQSKTDPRTARRPAPPAGFALLAAKDVRADLKLTEADSKALAAHAEKWEKLNTDRLTTISPKEADEQAAALKAESEKALAALKPEQATRLKQINFQTNGLGGFVGGFGRAAVDLHIDALYTNATVAKELAIGNEQVKEFAALRAAFEKDAAAVLSTADAFAPAEKKLNDLVAARRSKAEAMLSADQTAKLKALVGEPFTGNTRSDRLGGQTFGQNPQFLETLRAAMFGKYTTELNLLALNKSIQDELKLTEAQIKTAAEKYREVLAVRITSPLSGDSEAYEKAMAERSKVTETALGKLLDENQAKRFRQLMLQSRERSPNVPTAFTIGLPSAIVYPGVAEEVKLTDEQKKKLLAGEVPAEVLSAGQKSAIQKMLGEPFKGNYDIGKGSTFPTRFAPVPGAVRLLAARVPAAEEALKLTDDQMKALATARQAYQKAIDAARPLGLTGATPATSAEARRVAQEAFAKAVTGVLTAEQKQRLGQLVVQADAAQDLGATLLAPEMTKTLGLNDDQTAKITALGAEAARLHDLRTTHLRLARDQKLGLQMRDAADDRMMAVLTDAQKQTWKEQTGDPIAGLQKSVPFGRGFGPGGGFGGGPIGGGGFGP